VEKVHLNRPEPPQGGDTKMGHPFSRMISTDRIATLRGLSGFWDVRVHGLTPVAMRVPPSARALERDRSPESCLASLVNHLKIVSPPVGLPVLRSPALAGRRRAPPGRKMVVGRGKMPAHHHLLFYPRSACWRTGVWSSFMVNAPCLFR
jgi:hypothetical protein